MTHNIIALPIGSVYRSVGTEPDLCGASQVRALNYPIHFIITVQFCTVHEFSLYYFF